MLIQRSAPDDTLPILQVHLQHQLDQHLIDLAPVDPLLNINLLCQ